MQIPDELYYTADHEWVSVDGSTIRVGVTDFAQDALGDVVYVGLPDIDTELAVGDAFGEIESTKSVSDVYAPVAGTVVAINEALADQPELINTDPYGEGWLCELDVGEQADLSELLSATDYQALVEG